ncbi:12206_t:CDS:2 [Funneliformis geosporum]|uniref:12206_t:CDS:1 n=1 Tax=Funneliformis geosporum TaxID=1117311 RepID=A0A9W4WHS5_9GLOM|nr:12206_t:CDS:2 [Funneliformis geosporum]
MKDTFSECILQFHSDEVVANELKAIFHLLNIYNDLNTMALYYVTSSSELKHFRLLILKPQEVLTLVNY